MCRVGAAAGVHSQECGSVGRGERRQACAATHCFRLCVEDGEEMSATVTRCGWREL